MSETSKTSIFIVLAIAATAVAVGTRPRPVTISEAEDIGKPMFADFTDPAQAKSLKIIRFDESLASLNEIEIREKDGIWTLPSHDGYPADAENRIRDATTPFIDLTSLAVVSNLDGARTLYGVLEPNVNKSAVGDQGVGTLVTVSGDGGTKLVDLIIGKEVKDTEGQRYVRRAGQSPRIYIAKVDPDNLPVQFEDWIEKDLLKLNGWDISRVQLKDYNFDVGTRINYTQRSDMTVSDDGGTWKLDELQVDQGGDLVMADLGEDEQLNQARLGEIKDALDNLEIVNVQRKPEQLGADLREKEGFDNDQAGIDSLIERGFYPVDMPDGRREVLSADGEVRVFTKDGVEYVLRFGSVAGVDTESEDGALNRYLMVSANLDEGSFPAPDLEDVPQSIEDLKQDSSAADPTADDETSQIDLDTLTRFVQADGQAADEISGAETAETEAVVEVAVEDEVAEGGEVVEEAVGEVDEQLEAAAEGSAVEAANEVDETTVVEPEVEDAVDSVESEVVAESEVGAELETVVEESNEQATSESNEQVTVEPQLSEDELKEQLKAEQERITKENQRKIDERNDKVEKANETIRELNYRFADWYYVISDEVYQKIHVSRDDVVEAKQEESESADAAAPAPAGAGFNPLNLPTN